MRVPEILFVYLCLGAAVAAMSSGPRRWLALALWPLVLPSLLAGARERFDTAPTRATLRPGAGAAIGPALDRLIEALTLWQPEARIPLDSTRRALADLEARRGALAELLARPEYGDRPPVEAIGEAALQRRANVAALRDLHDQLEGELAGAIARIDELSTRIQLAHFGGRPMGDVAEQLAELVAAVDGVRAAHAEVEGGPGPVRGRLNRVI